MDVKNMDGVQEFYGQDFKSMGYKNQLFFTK